MTRAFAAVVLLVSAGLDLSAQATSSPASAQAPNSLALYRAFFNHVQFLEDEAVRADALGKPDAVELRAVYQKKVGLTAADTTVLKQWAATNTQAVQQLNSTAKQIILADRARYPAGKVPAGQSPPTAPSQLTLLTQQRDTITAAHIQSLKAALSADGAAKIDHFVQNQFSQNFKSNPLPNFKYPTSTTPGGAN